MRKKHHLNHRRLYRIDPMWARETLSHREMMALSGMFRRWALYEADFTPEQATGFIKWSSDYERLAKWVGPDHQPESQNDPVSLTKFLASTEFRHLSAAPLDAVRAVLTEGTSF